MPSVGDPDWHNLNGGPGLPSELMISLEPNAVLLVPLRPWNAPSRGFLVSSAWCLWIMHECGIHLQAKIDFPKYSHN